MHRCSFCGNAGHNVTTCTYPPKPAPPPKHPKGKHPRPPSPPSQAHLEILALLAQNPRMTQQELADARGVSRQAINLICVRFDITTRNGRWAEPKPLIPCKTCGKPLPHPKDSSRCRKYDRTRVCTGCGITFETPRFLGRKDRRYAVEAHRFFHTWDCMNRWKSTHGSEWFVRRRPQDWGFGGKRHNDPTP